MPGAVRQRSPSQHEGRKVKKQRQEGNLAIQIPSEEIVHSYHEKYEASTPYKHAVIGGLLSDELLEGVVEESRTYGVRGEEGSLPGWGWEQKETDIYKIQQTPDLSSLTTEHLPDETLAALPQLTKLKQSLYSEEFRSFVRQVTGCGPLSGKRSDASVGLYTQGSHLLLHDDSISTRLISYILYLPNSPPSAPEDPEANLVPSANGKFHKGWNRAWGGALELYPVENGEEAGVPGVKKLAEVPVKWGQIVFFEVKPGRSYHAVEEVIVGDGRQRLGISGWFHRPVEGEEGYAPLDPSAVKEDLSSLAQITSAPSLPLATYDSDPPAGLTPSHISFLAPFLAPSYLTAATLEKLSGQFVAASEIVLHNFLHPVLASKLKHETQSRDQKDYSSELLPAQDLGEGQGWTIQGPSSKHRYLSLSSTASTSTPTLQSILSTLIPSEAFRAWLSVVSSLAPIGYRAEARRFRRGLDYTLAAGEERGGEARLDVWLGATWWADVEGGSDEEDELVENGGWEAYVATPEEGEDPAVYQSRAARPAPEEQKENEEEKDRSVEATKGPEAGPSISIGGQELEFDPDQFSPSDFDSDSEDGSESDDGPLLTQAVSFNKLLLVLRDPGVMRFVKYLGNSAKGSRWDVGGEWEVGVVEEDEDGEPDEQQ
ncbi:prolyl 3-hydroxylase /prolyl 3,4-dihydroxylase, partial [Tremellales sp. Uapishka_1]